MKSLQALLRSYTCQRRKEIKTLPSSGGVRVVLSSECVDCEAHYNTLFQEENDNISRTIGTLFFFWIFWPSLHCRSLEKT